jgi:hypothetical protein
MGDELRLDLRGSAGTEIRLRDGEIGVDIRFPLRNGSDGAAGVIELSTLRTACGG